MDDETWIRFSNIYEMMSQKDVYHCGASIYLGNYHYYPHPKWLSPAQGWLSTNAIFVFLAQDQTQETI
jgi:hypothetical protein